MFDFQQPSNEPREEFSLLELNARIRGVMSKAFPSACWVRAEISDVRTNAQSGHCYLEFVEKNATSGQFVAKARGSIWANTFRRLKPYFEHETGQLFASGLKVLVKVTVEFHELYGYSLTVTDIDPAYTLGDMIRRRMQIVQQLTAEGVIGLNKALPLPTLPQRIAIITSETAAGYEDFMKQLMHNKAGFVFYTKLFTAVMQGEKTEESVIRALDNIHHHIDSFDVVVIIRGGGSTSDLNCFDSYLLAANCAQFPLPILSGIGHERDETVIDLVAHTRMKTPTAVAEFLVGCFEKAANEITNIQAFIGTWTTNYLQQQRNYLQQVGIRLPAIAMNELERKRSFLQSQAAKLPTAVLSMVSVQSNALDTIQHRLQTAVQTTLTAKRNALQMHEQYIRMVSPAFVLKRGYTLTEHNGKIVKRVADLQVGDTITIHYADGETVSKVEKINTR